MVGMPPPVIRLHRKLRMHRSVGLDVGTSQSTRCRSKRYRCVAHPIGPPAGIGCGLCRREWAGPSNQAVPRPLYRREQATAYTVSVGCCDQRRWVVAQMWGVKQGPGHHVLAGGLRPPTGARVRRCSVRIDRRRAPAFRLCLPRRSAPPTDRAGVDSSPRRGLYEGRG